MSRKKQKENLRSENGKEPAKPIEVADFIQLTGFSDEWDELRLIDQDLVDLENAIMASPSGSPVVKGTGGLRKLRFSPKTWKTGKSGALRVCYVYFKDCNIVMLVTVYRKADRDDISVEGRKKIRNFIQKMKEQFAKRPIKKMEDR